MTRRRRRGFTVLEFAVAMSIALTVFYMAVYLLVQIGHAINRKERTNEADVQAKILVDQLISGSQGVGGYGVRPHAAVAIELQGCPARGDLPPCGLSDRVTILRVESSKPPVDVTLSGPTRLTAPETCGATNTVCCLDELPGGGALDYTNTAAFIFDPVAVAHKPVRTTSRVGACDINFADAVNSPATMTVAGFASGTLHAGFLQTYWRNDVANELRVWVDADLDGVMDPIELSLLASGIFDLQVALGYDVDGNGTVDDTGSAGDEWLGNHGADAMGAGGLAGALPPHLRMIMFGLIVGIPSPYSEANETARVLDGIPVVVPQRAVRASAGRATFRNLNLFF